MALSSLAVVFELELASPALKMVLLCLADAADSRGIAEVPHARLAYYCSLSERQVRATLAELQEAGLITPAGAGKLGRPAWRLNLPGEIITPQREEPKDAKKCPPKLRAAVIAGFLQSCPYCGLQGGPGLGPDGEGWVIERLISGAQGGAYTPDNVSLACASCNRRHRWDDRGLTTSLAMLLARRRAAIEGEEIGRPEMPGILPGKMPGESPDSGQLPASSERAEPTIPFSNDQEQLTPKESLALNSSAILELWNALVSAPVPKVRDLTPDRRRRLEKLLKVYPRREDWEVAIRYLNLQPWCRGQGSGDFARWVMSLDWLIRKDSTLGRYRDAAQARRSGLASGAQVREQTRRSNAAEVARGGIFVPELPDEGDEP